MATTDVNNSGAAALLRSLTDHAVDYVFANAGTDFAPIIEALVAMEKTGEHTPRFLTMPHETVAISMAHGYYAMSGKIPVAMVHTTVGTANATMGVMNAARDNIPLVLLAGRTPITQNGHEASRSGHIHWGQESFDQGGMIREYVKWDYEVRHGQPIGEIINRAVRIANAAPCGPVYVILPREVLVDPATSSTNLPLLRAPRRPLPNSEDIQDLGQLIKQSKFPVIATSFAGKNIQAAKQLAAVAEYCGIPVVQPFARYVNLSSDHPMHVGFESKLWIERADLILVIDCDVPYIPRFVTVNPDAKVVHIGTDPTFSRIPYRTYPSCLDVCGETEFILSALNKDLRKRNLDIDLVESRKKTIAKHKMISAKDKQEIIDGVRHESPIAPAWLGHCLAEAIPEDTIIVNELGVPLNFLSFPHLGSMIGNGIAGGLGQALGTALGVKLAKRNSTVVAIVGNGCYIFGAPTAYHHVANVENLPILTIVQNNARWQAVDESTRAVYPDGYAASESTMPLVDLGPTPDFALIAKASGAWSKTVTQSHELPDALSDALLEISKGRQALLDVRTGITGPRCS